MRKFFLTAALSLGVVTAAPAMASEGGHIKRLDWPQDGIFGTYDRASLQRGLQVYQQVCASCHGLKRVAFRTLTDLGFTMDQVKKIAAEYEFEDGPDEEGEMFTRPGAPYDYFPSPFPNEKAAAAANGGAVPPDLSLIVKARRGREDYVYSILTGYEEAPDGFTVPEGGHYNSAFPGNVIAMPPPLSEDAVEYADGTPATVEQMAKDVVNFLSWAAEPKMEERKRIGLRVVIFLVILIGLLYGIYRRVWARVDH